MNAVSVLVLVDVEVAIALRECVSDGGMVSQEAVGLDEEVVEV